MNEYPDVFTILHLNDYQKSKNDNNLPMYFENKCDDVYRDYKEDYGNKLSFICEDRNLKKYRHYNK